MALQDLTPQLRTRLNRMERAVGWFVFLATALLLFGFGYYIYHTAERKGWFKIKAKFHTFVQSSAGMNTGDKVYMMGFPIGQITDIHAMPPGDKHDVFVEFEIIAPYFRYIRAGSSYVKVNSGLLSQRELEVTRGTNGYAICVTQPVFVFSNLDELHKKITDEPDQWQLSQDVFDENSNLIFHAYDTLTESNLQAIAALKPDSIYAYNNREKDEHRIVASWHPKTHRYENFKPGSDDAWLKTVETPPLGDQLQAMVSQVQSALPGILALTNKISTVLDSANTTLGNAALATSNLNTTIVSAQPLVTNFTDISGQLREPGGVMNWALGTNGNDQVQGTLTNIDALLENLSGITSNLNAQVQSNTNMLGGIAKTIMDTDDFVQGLKRHWLLRSAFKVKTTNAPPPVVPFLPPRMR